jgi:glycerophosphoryl diester phosphodiesterase
MTGMRAFNLTPTPTPTSALTLALIASTSLLVGCATPPGSRDGAALAAFFDCAREKGLLISAHRAVLDETTPENSLAGIRATGGAIRPALLEIDVTRTLDGALVLMHDDTLDRTTTGHGRVADNTLAQVRATRLTDGNGKVTDAAPPTLREALDAAGKVGAIVTLDFKSGGSDGEILTRQVIAETRAAQAAHRAVLIVYNNQDALRLAALAPEMMISVPVSSPQHLTVLTEGGLSASRILAWTGTRTENPTLWTRLRQAGVEPMFGTLGAPGRRADDRYAADGDPSEYRDLFAAGVAVIGTDTPKAVKAMLPDAVAAPAACKLG